MQSKTLQYQNGAIDEQEHFPKYLTFKELKEKEHTFKENYVIIAHPGVISTPYAFHATQNERFNAFPCNKNHSK